MLDEPGRLAATLSVAREVFGRWITDRAVNRLWKCAAWAG